MPRVRFIKDWGRHRAGDETIVNHKTFKELIELAVAKAIIRVPGRTDIYEFERMPPDLTAEDKEE